MIADVLVPMFCTRWSQIYASSHLSSVLHTTAGNRFVLFYLLEKDKMISVGSRAHLSFILFSSHYSFTFASSERRYLSDARETTRHRDTASRRQTRTCKSPPRRFWHCLYVPSSGAALKKSTAVRSTQKAHTRHVEPLGHICSLKAHRKCKEVLCKYCD